ncbi:MAG: 2Fe-2S iron-sulfur cluster-binding protein, partial [Acidimicrobiia bacterium]
MTVSVRINGSTRETDRAERLLLDWLRDDLGLTGTKYGCGEGECGACTVLVDGEARLACLTTVGTIADRDVTTIEGLQGDPAAIDVIEALAAGDAVQCGFCTPGMVVSLAGASASTSASAVEAIAGNLCRCTGYRPLVTATAGLPLRALEHDRPGAVMTAGYKRPADLETALALLADGDHTILAGGTDLLVRGDHRGPVVDVTALPELAEV